MATRTSPKRLAGNLSKLAGLGPVSFGVPAISKIGAIYSPKSSRKTTILVKGKRKAPQDFVSTVFGATPQPEWGELLRETRKELGLDQASFSTLLACSLRTLTEYEKGEAVKESVRVRLRELRRLLEILRSVILDEEQLLAWLHSQVRDLGNRTPLQAFAAGDSGEIYALVYGALGNVAQ